MPGLMLLWRRDFERATQTGQLTMTGKPAGVTKSARPAAGQLTVTGQAPQLAKGVLPPTGALLVTGFTPLLGKSVAPLPGALTITGTPPGLGPHYVLMDIELAMMDGELGTRKRRAFVLVSGS
jgi:hypothetical protein